MLVTAQLYVAQQYQSFYLTIIDLMFYFVFNYQFNYIVFQSLQFFIDINKK